MLPLVYVSSCPFFVSSFLACGVSSSCLHLCCYRYCRNVVFSSFPVCFFFVVLTFGHHHCWMMCPRSVIVVRLASLVEILFSCNPARCHHSAVAFRRDYDCSSSSYIRSKRVCFRPLDASMEFRYMKAGWASRTRDRIWIKAHIHI